MAENELHPFASPPWTTVPFATHPKVTFDKLVDILFAAQRCLSIANRLITCEIDDAHKLKTELRTLIQDAMFQIQQWHSECVLSQEALKRGEKPVSVSDDDFTTSSDPRHFLLPYTDVPSAALVSLYDAANIILLRLLHLVSPTAASHDARVRQHTQSILSAHDMVTVAPSSVPGRSSIMLVLQLKVAALWSSSSRQRAVAVKMLKGFQDGGFAGISAPSHEYFADVVAYILCNTRSND